jgi:hypothetical protein
MIFGRCVEPAAQAAAILWTWTTIAFMADSHSRSITAGDSLVRRLQRLARPLIDRALDDATGMRARMPHGGAETAVHGAAAQMTTKVLQEMTVRARHGVVADLASRRTPISSHHI